MSGCRGFHICCCACVKRLLERGHEQNVYLHMGLPAGVRTHTVSDLHGYSIGGNGGFEQEKGRIGRWRRSLGLYSCRRLGRDGWFCCIIERDIILVIGRDKSDSRCCHTIYPDCALRGCGRRFGAGFAQQHDTKSLEWACLDSPRSCPHERSTVYQEFPRTASVRNRRACWQHGRV